MLCLSGQRQGLRRRLHGSAGRKQRQVIGPLTHHSVAFGEVEILEPTIMRKQMLWQFIGKEGFGPQKGIRSG